MELLECKHLCKEFDNKKVLDDIILKIPRGKIIGLLGKNGAGKSTLIKLVNDLLTPTSGEILFNGKIILTSSADDLRSKENKSIDEVFREVFKC